MIKPMRRFYCAGGGGGLVAKSCPTLSTHGLGTYQAPPSVSRVVPRSVFKCEMIFGTPGPPTPFLSSLACSPAAEGTDTLVVAVFIFPRCTRAHALAAITQLPPSLPLLGELRGFQAPEVNGKQMEPFFSLALLKGAEHCRASCFWQS